MYPKSLGKITDNKLAAAGYKLAAAFAKVRFSMAPSRVMRKNVLAGVVSRIFRKMVCSSGMKSTVNGGVLEDLLQVLHVHVRLVAPLGAGHMSQPGTDQHERGVAVRETACHTGTVVDLLVQSLNDIVGADTGPVSDGITDLFGDQITVNGSAYQVRIFNPVVSLESHSIKMLAVIFGFPVVAVVLLEDIDKIKGLGMGADDYITKPFSPNVLVARIKAHLAQYDRLKNGGKSGNMQIQMGNFLIREDSRRVFVDGTEVALKNKKYELLLFLMSNADIVFSKETLYERIWGSDALGDNATIAVHINRLREKIEKKPSVPRYIQTVWEVGYRFKP